MYMHIRMYMHIYICVEIYKRHNSGSWGGHEVQGLRVRLLLSRASGGDFARMLLNRHFGNALKYANLRVRLLCNDRRRRGHTYCLAKKLLGDHLRHLGRLASTATSNALRGAWLCLKKSLSMP